MNRRHRSWGAALALVAGVTAWPNTSRAQTPPNVGPPPGGTIGEEEPKKQGVAEKAPQEAARLPTLPPLPPYPGQEKKKFELVTLDGYMRMRIDWLKQFHQGFHDTTHGIPFPEPISCTEGTPETVDGDCGDSLGTTNMRVRLEPTIHLSETVALHLQVDFLDNLVLGSNPRGYGADGIHSLASSQSSPDQKDSPWDSIRVKQAWGDVHTPLGDLRFGRVPNQWGLGILNHAGGYDWIHGTTCTDCDYGDTADRLIFGTTIPGTSIRAAVGLDWGSSSPTSGQVGAGYNRVDGQPFDLDDHDDVTQYVIMFTHLDEPDVWNQTLKTGGFAANYGLQFYYRVQDIEFNPAIGGTAPEATGLRRDLSVYIPDLWGRITTSKFVAEGELVGIFGSVDNLVDPMMEDMTIRQIGGVARLMVYFLGQDLELGLEGGFASGDEWEDPKYGTINIHQANYLPRSPTDTTLSMFHFNPDYHVDLILFRELFGAVINAGYVKPWIRYNITDRFAFKAAVVTSFALVPVATPGNSTFYGIEVDGDLGYSNEKEGFFAGLSYGVLFPFAALDHPIALFPEETSNGASTSQTLQGRLVLKF